MSERKNSAAAQRNDPFVIERALRQRVSEIEYRVLQSRLTGAIKAIAFLRARAPDLVPLMFGDGLEQAKTLPLHTQSALATLVEELLLAAATTATKRPAIINKKLILRLVSRLDKRR